ncbi:MAG TPA: UvrY/SirA/GacA family response regulator transcription factor [Gammaproteobacteria bacterium]|jgi:two-component system invasion response regulator UvrY
MIGVLLVDDHKLIRTGIKLMLEKTTDIRVLGEASSGEEAVEQARALKPQVILMDVSMPGIGGLEATRKLAMSLPDAKVIVLSAQTAEPFPMRLMEAGASGYLTKDSAEEEIITAIRRVNAGERYIAAEIARSLALQAVNRNSNAGGSPFDQLSAREMQVMIMATGGHSVQDISDKLHLSPKTVSTYRSRLFEKLGVGNDVELMRLALRYGVIEEKTSGGPGVS